MSNVISKDHFHFAYSVTTKAVNIKNISKMFVLRPITFKNQQTKTRQIVSCYTDNKHSRHTFGIHSFHGCTVIQTLEKPQFGKYFINKQDHKNVSDGSQFGISSRDLKVSNQIKSIMLKLSFLLSSSSSFSHSYYNHVLT